MEIKVLGSGCPSCIKLEKNVLAALDKMGKEATVKKVTEMKDIMSYNVMSTPALVVDEVVVAYGQVLSPEKIESLLQK